MHPKYRNSSDRFWSGPSYGRSRIQGGGGGGGVRGDFSRSYSKSYNPSRKHDVLMQAARLAVEFLVSNDVLPPNSLQKGSSFSEGRHSDFRGHGRETPSQPQAPAEARPRHGHSSVPDSSYGRRRFDDYDSRMSGRGRKRMGYHSRDYDPEPDFGRERKRNGWSERSGGGYAECAEEEENSPPGYRRDRRARYDKARSGVSRGAGDEQQSKIEVPAEMESELDDAGSKVSSNSRRKEVRTGEDGDINKGMDNISQVAASNVEAGEVNSKAASESQEVEKKDSLEVDKPDEVKRVSTRYYGNYLSEICGFAKIPKKPRSLMFPINQVLEQGPSSEVSIKVEAPSVEDSNITVGKVPADGSSREAPIALVGNLKHETPLSPNKIETKKESLVSLSEMQKNTECLRSSVVSVHEPIPNNCAHISQPEEIKMEAKLPPSGTPQINEYSHLDGVRAVQPSLADIQPEAEQMLKEVSQLKPVDSFPVAKVDPHSLMGTEEENQNQPAFFKICDLNLTGTPEITEVPDDPVQENRHVAVRPLEGNGKVILITDLEDDSLGVNNSDAAKPKNEVIYPEHENVYNHTSHADDNSVLTISDYLGADMPCSPVQTDLNNLQAGITLNASEGFTGVDDAIYGSLGDIGFMEAWDQPAHDYGKFY